MAWIIFFAAVTGGPHVTYADYPLSKVMSDNYFERATARFVNGVSNLTLNWTVLFDKNANNLPASSQTQLDRFFERFAVANRYAAIGVWDLATFWVPGSIGKKMAADENYKQGKDRLGRSGLEW